MTGGVGCGVWLLAFVRGPVEAKFSTCCFVVVVVSLVDDTGTGGANGKICRSGAVGAVGDGATGNCVVGSGGTSMGVGVWTRSMASATPSIRPSTVESGRSAAMDSARRRSSSSSKGYW